jgi:hypothetical protein
MTVDSDGLTVCTRIDQNNHANSLLLSSFFLAGSDSLQVLSETVEKTVTSLLLGVQRISKITETRNEQNEQQQTTEQEQQGNGGQKYRH